MGTRECGLCGKIEDDPTIIGHRVDVCPECAAATEAEDVFCPKCYSDRFVRNEELTGWICLNCGFEGNEN